MNVAFLAFLAKSFGQFRKRMIVKFVVAEDINERQTRKARASPSTALPADVNIAGENDCVGLD
jgi:hypothetical protein